MNYSKRMKEAIKKLPIEKVFPPFSGPAPDEEIDKVASELGLPIVGSYREFCRLLGDQNDYGFCGVNVKYDDAGTLWATRLLRRQYNLPANYLVVWVEEGFDEACALDCDQPHGKEFPVFAFCPYSWEDSLTKVADSFVEAFENYYRIGLGHSEGSERAMRESRGTQSKRKPQKRKK